MTIVAHPCDETSLRGATEAAEAGIIVPVLVGPGEKISSVARHHQFDISRYKVVDAPNSDAAAATAVQLIREGKGELLMKGSLHTDELMQASPLATGLRTGRRLSHVFIMDVPHHSETLFITDAAINIFPDLDVKRDIVQNAIDLFTQSGWVRRVSLLFRPSRRSRPRFRRPSKPPRSAKWRIADRSPAEFSMGRSHSTMRSTLKPRGSRAFDLRSPARRRFWWCRISKPATCSPRTLIFLSKADAAGLVLGARVPIILTSRADCVRSGWPLAPRRPSTQTPAAVSRP